jgi:hypothetical protein
LADSHVGLSFAHPMSKSDLFTSSETEAAAADGWLICDVYDLQKKVLRRQIFPTRFPQVSVEQAGRHVVANARLGNKLALKALRLLNEGTSHEQRQR